MKPYIETYSGREFWFMDPSEDDISIEDIAAALSKICRFTGHTKKFYSVAEHSINVSQLCSPEEALAGLLHDAAETYLGDIASPIKQYLFDYHKWENNILEKIFNKYDLTYPPSYEVKQADAIALKSEAFHLMETRGRGWDIPGDVLFTPKCWTPEQAEENFLAEFTYLRMELLRKKHNE